MPLKEEVRNEIFNIIKAAMEKQSPPMVISKDSKTAFELIGNKTVPYGYKKEMVPGIYFSSVVARKDMVSFYFFPMYMNAAEFTDLIPSMIKCLKGKTCFHIKKAEQVNEKELKALLKKGINAWKKMGYMK